MSSIASKSYSSGDVIFTSEPLVYVLDLEFKGIHCDYCFMKNGSLKKCSHCNKMYYCDRECQQNDWKCHKLECDFYFKFDIFEMGNDRCERQWLMVENNSLCRILMRLWLLIKSDPSIALKKYYCHNGQQRCLNDLITHTNDIKNDKQRMLWFSQICEKFGDFGIEVCIEKLLELFGRIAVNSYECKSYDVLNFSQYSNKFLGFGLYIPISVFNHSCQPNAAYINFGNKIQIRALKPIAVNEHIFIDYLPLERSKFERRIILKKDWYFFCMCTKCESNFDDSVDYEALEGLIQLNQQKLHQNFVSEHQLLVLKQTYNGFHPGYSFYLLINLLERINVYLNNSNGYEKTTKNSILLESDIRKSILLTFENLLITHGKNHETYQLLENIIYKFNFQNIIE